MLAITHALVKFRQYLVGSKFVIKIDHNSLRHFLSHKYFNDRQKKWVSKVQYFDFDIEYKMRKMNVVVYSLSRKPVLAMLKLNDDWKLQLAVEYYKNQFACDLFNGIIHDESYKILNDLIYHK